MLSTEVAIRHFAGLDPRASRLAFENWRSYAVLERDDHSYTGFAFGKRFCIVGMVSAERGHDVSVLGTTLLEESHVLFDPSSREPGYELPSRDMEISAIYHGRFAKDLSTVMEYLFISRHSGGV